MSKNIYSELTHRIEQAEPGTVFLTKDFTDLANQATIRKYLGRQVEQGKIVRVMNGVYEKPRFSRLLNRYILASPASVAAALARQYHWTIAPSGNMALNQLGLSTQVPAACCFISDGPYREFQCNNTKITFLHRTNKNISNKSLLTIMVIEAFRTLGKERVSDKTLITLKSRLNEEDKRTLLQEACGTYEWIYQEIRKVCAT